jgi:serine/threonine protein kinase
MREGAINHLEEGSEDEGAFGLANHQQGAWANRQDGVGAHRQAGAPLEVVGERTAVQNPPDALLESERGPRTLQSDGQTPVDLEPPPISHVARGHFENEAPGLIIDNRYVLGPMIARGGMGVVFRCQHMALGKELAVKIIRQDIAHLVEGPQRLLIEARAASAIGNEHIIDVRDFGTLPDGSAYLVMELLDGVPLSEIIAQRQRLPNERILSIGIQDAEGLAAAHSAGIVHRDLKPENVFLVRRPTPDFVKILDFGIAKMRRTETPKLTGAGVIVGTPDYMSPEQAAGATIDPRADIYSLGVMLYELAAGRVPFYSNSYVGLLTKIMTEPAPPFRALIPPPDVPPEFEGIVLKCLEKHPGQRFQSMSELLEMLADLYDQLGPPLPPRRISSRPSARSRRPSSLPVPPPPALSREAGERASPPSGLGASGSVIPRGQEGAFGSSVLAGALIALSLGWLWHVHDRFRTAAAEPPPATARVAEPVAVETHGSVPAVVTPWVPPEPEAPAAPSAASVERAASSPARATKTVQHARRSRAEWARHGSNGGQSVSEAPAHANDSDLLDPWHASP